MPQPPSANQSQRARVERGETTHALHLELTCLDGTRKTVLCSASALRERGGKVIGAVVLLHDLADERKIEADLEQRVARLVSAAG